MDRRTFLGSLIASPVAAGIAVAAQPAPVVPRRLSWLREDAAYDATMALARDGKFGHVHILLDGVDQGGSMIFVADAEEGYIRRYVPHPEYPDLAAPYIPAERRAAFGGQRANPRNYHLRGHGHLLIEQEWLYGKVEIVVDDHSFVSA